MPAPPTEAALNCRAACASPVAWLVVGNRGPRLGSRNGDSCRIGIQIDPERAAAAMGRADDEHLAAVALLTQMLESGLEDLEEAHRRGRVFVSEALGNAPPTDRWRSRTPAARSAVPA
jgi:hypothetical protein